MQFIPLFALIISIQAVPERCNLYGNIYQVYPVDVCNSDFGSSQIGKCSVSGTVSVDYYDSNDCVGPFTTESYDCSDGNNLCECDANGNGVNAECSSFRIKYCDCADDPNCLAPLFDIESVADECVVDGDGGVITTCDYPLLSYTYYSCADCACSADVEFRFDYSLFYGACSILECNAAGPGSNGFTQGLPTNTRAIQAIEAAMKPKPAAKVGDISEISEISRGVEDKLDNTWNGRYLLLNVGVSAVSCFFVVACCLMIYYMVKCRNRKKELYAFEKVDVSGDDEEENMIEDK